MEMACLRNGKERGVFLPSELELLGTINARYLAEALIWAGARYDT